MLVQLFDPKRQVLIIITKVKILLLLILMFSIIIDAQKKSTPEKQPKKNIISKRDGSKKTTDNWQKFEYFDFSINFPNKPKLEKDVFGLAENSLRYTTFDKYGIEYVAEYLNFSADFWNTMKGFDERKTIYDNLEMQLEIVRDAKLTHSNTISIQGETARISIFDKIPDVSNVQNIKQIAVKKDNKVYVIRVVLPLSKLNNPDIDFIKLANSFFRSFEFATKTVNSEKENVQLPSSNN